MIDWIEPPAMASVEIGSGLQQDCSPSDPAPVWEGLLLVAPTKVMERKNEPTRVPVCGRYSVDIKHVTRPIAVLSVWINSERAMPPLPISLDDPADEVGRPVPFTNPGQRYLNNNVGGFFAIDLGTYIRFPRHPARVEFRLEFGGHVSKTHSFEWLPSSPR